MQFRDRVKFTTATVGTGPITVGAADVGFRTPAQAGLLQNQTSAYVIEDGTAWETGFTEYTEAGAIMSRIFHDSSTGSLLNLSGSAKVFYTITSEAFEAVDFRGAMTLISLGMFSS